MLQRFEYPHPKHWKDILKRPVADLGEIEKKVLPIMDKVRLEGDKALRELTLSLDKVWLEELEVDEEEISAAEGKLSQALKDAIHKAIDNITIFHLQQKNEEHPIETERGVLCWRKWVGIEKVGLYIPGGTAPLFSTVLMLAIPASIAGCSEVIICTPPDQDGDVHPAILYAAQKTGVHKIFKIGGAQAIAAMTFGTESVPATYKIFGPGNQYVTAAKQLALRYGVAIDMPAGPSEVLVIADSSANPEFIAADLLSQAEHGIDSQVVFVTNDASLPDKVEVAIKKQLSALSRAELAISALSNSKAILVHNLEEAVAVSNTYAPEHLILQVAIPELLVPLIKNAGSVFMGHYTPESAGDYASGTNHTLPTNGYARAYSGVSLDSFVRKITFQQISEIGIQQLGPVIIEMAEAEQLTAHAQAVTVRLNQLKLH
jgi:histidinol dehydrogenase